MAKTHIIGGGVCGPGEAGRFLEQTLKEYRRIGCDDVLLVLNNTSPREKALCYKYKIKFYQDNREWGKFQKQIKERLMLAMSQFNPDWVFMLDMDEVVDNKLDRKGLEGLTLTKHDAFHFYLVNLWNDYKHYRPDMCFWRVHFYRYAKDRGFRYGDGGFDPALVPHWAASSAAYAPFIVKHYGIIDPATRLRKIERYRKYDRGGQSFPEYIQQLAMETPGESFNEDVIHANIAQEVAQNPIKTKTLIQSTMAIFHYLRRTIDGAQLDIPDADLHETMKRRNSDGTPAFQYLGRVDSSELPKDIPIIEEAPATISPAPNELLCNACGFQAQSERTLKGHTTRVHKTT